MRHPARFIKNRNLILLSSLVLGLVFEDPAYSLKATVLPCLALIMSLSTTTVSSTVFRSTKSMLIPAAIGAVVSYGFHGGLLLLLNSLLIRDADFWTGFVIISAIPPAVAVIPFSLFLKADSEFVLFAAIGAYLSGLFITPLIFLVFFGAGIVNPVKLCSVLFELIIGPLISSRILIRTGLSRKIEPVKGSIINWGFFLLTYTITGLNRDFILQKPVQLILPVILCIFSTFIFGWIIEVIGKLWRLNDRILRGLILLGTYKNWGLAGGLSLTSFIPQAAVPATLASSMGILYIIYLQIRTKK